MLGNTQKDLVLLYQELENRYDLVLTTSKAVDENFTVDCPMLVGRANGLDLWLYLDGGMLVLDVMDFEKGAGTHWHPINMELAKRDIEEFMEGRSDYTLTPFPKKETI